MSVAILVIPVSLQIFSRYTALIPSYIWTEEMARFLFIWTIMIGAMIGVRESHAFRGRCLAASVAAGEALVRLIGPLRRVGFALVFVSAGIQFTEFAWYRISELADLPLWLIHVAWPVTGVTWLVFLGEQLLDDLRIILRENAHDRLRAVAGQSRRSSCSASSSCCMFLRVPVAFALGLACLPILMIEPRLTR